MRKLSGEERRSYIAIGVAIIMGIPQWLSYLGITPSTNVALPDLSFLVPWIPFVTLALGLYAGVGLAKRITASKKANTARESVQATQEQEVRQTLKSLPIDLKTMLYVLATHDYIYSPLDQWQYNEEMKHPFFKQFMTWETIGRTTVRIESSELLKVAVERYADVFSVITDEMMREYAIYDPNHRKQTIVHRSSGIDWWWYSTEPYMDQEKQFEEQLSKQGQGHSPMSALGMNSADCGGGVE